MKKIELLSSALLLAVVILLSMISCQRESGDFVDSSEIKSMPGSILKEAVLSFETPIDIEQLKLIESNYRVKITQIEAVTKIGRFEVTEGMNLFDEINLDEVPGRLTKNFEEETRLLIETYTNDRNLTTSDRAEAIKYYELLGGSIRTSSLIHKVMIIGSESSIISLKKEFSNGDIEFVDKILRGYQIEKEVMESRSLPVWKPNAGTMEVGSVSSTKRFVSHTMKWTNTNPFNGYSNATYEHDFFLNNYSGSNYPGTYLSLAEDSQERPLVDYWTCTLPSPYLDTRFGDDNNEIAYTIGCANANAIVKNVLYSNYMKINKGSANMDNSKLLFQKGYRLPSGCYTTWCSYGNANYVQFPAWTFVVPAGISWAN